MFDRQFSKNKASVSHGSNNNIVQDSVINNNNNIIINTGTSDIIKILGQTKQYEPLQAYVTNILNDASKVHPLYPIFSAKFNKDLSRLVSTPETEDAFNKYPKSIKETFQIDYNQYPHMDKSETPWEYAYRTQTPVKLETTAYQEYLRDHEDPFPVIKYEDGMITEIKAPPFPEAVEATIISGKVSIPIMLQRKPCMEYGKLVFGTVSNDSGFEFTLTTNENVEETDFTIKRLSRCDLFKLLQTEKLLLEMKKTQHLTVMIGSSTLLDASLQKNELTGDMFEVAPFMLKYFESLLIIEKSLSCKFDLTTDSNFLSDYKTAVELAESLENKWHIMQTDYEEIRCDYDHISDDIVNSSEIRGNIGFTANMLEISLQGLRFYADRYIITYQDAKVNNVASVLKNRKKKRKNILITFKPVQGKNKFYKFCRFEGVRLLSDA